MARRTTQTIICDNCQKTTSDAWIYVRIWEREWDLCSVGCLTEFAWKLREQQPKLSKSKMEDPDA